MRAKHCYTWVNRPFKVVQPNLGKMPTNTVYVWVNRQFHKSDFLTSKMHPTSRGLKFSRTPENAALRTNFAHFADLAGFANLLGVSHFLDFGPWPSLGKRTSYPSQPTAPGTRS